MHSCTPMIKLYTGTVLKVVQNNTIIPLCDISIIYCIIELCIKILSNHNKLHIDANMTNLKHPGLSHQMKSIWFIKELCHEIIGTMRSELNLHVWDVLAAE